MTRPYTVSDAVVEQRRDAATRHGAHSAQIVPRARAQKRRLLRQIGLRAADLDPIALGLLDAWASCAAKRRALDAFMETNGMLRDAGTGEGWPFMSFYVSLVNSERLTLGKLADHLRASGRGEASMVLELQRGTWRPAA